MLNAGYSDWIAIDRQDYVRKGVRFARDLENLSDTRQTLRQQVTGSPLFDGARFAMDFQSAVWGMWESLDV